MNLYCQKCDAAVPPGTKTCAACRSLPKAALLVSDKEWLCVFCHCAIIPGVAFVRLLGVHCCANCAEAAGSPDVPPSSPNCPQCTPDALLTSPEPCDLHGTSMTLHLTDPEVRWCVVCGEKRTDSGMHVKWRGKECVCMPCVNEIRAMKVPYNA